MVRLLQSTSFRLLCRNTLLCMRVQYYILYGRVGGVQNCSRLLRLHEKLIMNLFSKYIPPGLCEYLRYRYSQIIMLKIGLHASFLRTLDLQTPNHIHATIRRARSLPSSQELTQS